jgi:hypothetical protein
LRSIAASRANESCGFAEITFVDMTSATVV